MKYQLQELIDRAPESIRLHFREKTFPAGVLILPTPNAQEHLYLILSGAVEVHKESYSGTDISINLFEAGSFFGEIELFCPDLAPYQVRAKTDCTCIVVPKDVVFEWMQKDFGLTFLICETSFRRLYIASDSMSRIAMLSLKQRILGCLEQEYRMGTLPTFTKQMLVAQIRAPLRSINRILRACAEEGIIEYRHKTFLVLDEARLATYAREYEI